MGMLHNPPSDSDPKQPGEEWSLFLFPSDDTRQYRIHAAAFPAVLPSVDHHDVTLVTQTSIDQLHHLHISAAGWAGPVSVAVFITSVAELYEAINIITHLRACSQSVKDNVSFHFCYDQTVPGWDSVQPSRLPNLLVTGAITSGFHAPVPFIVTEQGTSMACPQAQVKADYTLNYRHTVPYPNNLLRNLARRMAGTSFVFVTDVDMVPSKGLRQQFLSLVKSQMDTAQVAWVVPGTTRPLYAHVTVMFTYQPDCKCSAFEVQPSIELPREREDLVAAVQAKTAQVMTVLASVYMYSASRLTIGQHSLSTRMRAGSAKGVAATPSGFCDTL